MKVAVVTGSIPTSGTHTISGPSGFGTPEALILIAGLPGSSGVTAELWDHIGFATASAQGCEAAWVADAATSGTAGNYKRISYDDRIYTDDAEGVNLDAVSGGPVTDGWEIDLDAAPGATIPYIALLLTDTGGVAVGHAVDTAGAVTGLGFEPSFGLFATTGRNGDGSEDTVATLGFGVVDSAGADYCHNLVKRSSTTNTIGESRSGTMLAYKVLLTTDAWSLNFDSWDSDGFSFTDTSGDGDRFLYLVLDPGSTLVTVSVETTPGATGDASFDPGHVVEAIFGRATAWPSWPDSSQDAEAGAAATFAASATAEGCLAIAAEQGANPTDTQHEVEQAAVFDVPTDEGAGTEIAGTVTDISDVTIDFTTANARGFLLVAFEGEAGSIEQADGSFAAAATLSAGSEALKEAAGSVVAASTIAAIGEAEHRAVGSITGASTFAGAAASEFRAVAAAACVATFVGTASPEARAAGSFGATSSFASVGESLHESAGAFTGASAFEAAGAAEYAAAGTLNATCSILAASAALKEGIGDFASVASFTGAARGEHEGTGSFEGASEFSGIAEAEHRGVGAFACTASFEAVGDTAASGTGTGAFSAVCTMAAAAAAEARSLGSWQASCTISGAGAADTEGQGAFAAQATIQGTARSTDEGVGAFSSASAFAAASVAEFAGAGAFQSALVCTGVAAVEAHRAGAASAVATFSGASEQSGLGVGEWTATSSFLATSQVEGSVEAVGVCSALSAFASVGTTAHPAGRPVAKSSPTDPFAPSGSIGTTDPFAPGASMSTTDPFAPVCTTDPE